MVADEIKEAIRDALEDAIDSVIKEATPGKFHNAFYTQSISVGQITGDFVNRLIEKINETGEIIR